MTKESEASSLIEPSENESNENLERNAHGKLVTMPQRRRKNNFKAGESGNPTGKPKGALHRKTILEGMMKYNMIVSPTLLRRSEAVLQNVLQRAEEGDKESERLVLQYVLTPFIKMQALKSSGLKGEGKPVVNINITQAEGVEVKGRTFDH